jgi:Tfp pilus assembly protein FimT
LKKLGSCATIIIEDVDAPERMLSPSLREESVKRRKGFTLMEFIISMGIIMVIITMLAPNFQGISSQTICKNAASALYSDLMASEKRSMDTCLECGILFNTNSPADDGTYQVYEGTQSNIVKTVCLSRVFSKEVKFRARGRCGLTYANGQPFRIYFLPNRRCSDGSGWGMCETHFNLCYSGDLTIIAGVDSSVIGVETDGALNLN